MELRWLRAFLAVAEERNFSRAAARLHIAQPAVSQLILRLEKELEVKLFDRDKRTVRLTDAGNALLLPSREILRSVEAARSRARNAGSGEYGRIRLGFNAAFVADRLSSLARRVRDEYPNLELDIDVTRRTPEVLAMIEQSELDLGLVGGPVKGSGLAWRTLSMERVGVQVPKAHPLTRLAEVPVEALRDETLVFTAAQPGWTLKGVVDEACERAGFRPRRVLEVSDGMTVTALTNAGVGLSFISSGSQSLITRGMEFRPLAENVLVQTSVVWKASEESPALNNVLRIVHQGL